MDNKNYKLGVDFDTNTPHTELNPSSFFKKTGNSELNFFKSI